MKRKLYLIILLLFVSLIEFGVNASPTMARSYYISRTPYPKTGNCTRNGFYAYGTFSWSLPSDRPFVHNISSMNGVVFEDLTWQAHLGSTIGEYRGAMLFSSASYPFPQPIPYTVHLSQDWMRPHDIVFAHTETIVTCNKAGFPPIVEEYSTP